MMTRGKRGAFARVILRKIMHAFVLFFSFRPKKFFSVLLFVVLRLAGLSFSPSSHGEELMWSVSELAPDPAGREPWFP